MTSHRSLQGSFVVLASLLAAGEVPAQEPERQVAVVAGPQYEAGWFHRVFLGDNWRHVWTTPLRVPVLDLSGFAGGLEPERQGGGNQSRTLHMIDASGEGWVFRSVDKFTAQGLPPELKGSPLGAAIGDGTSTLLPAGALVMPRLLAALDILHVEPKLYVMPDDPRLGEYRATFAGMLGGLEFKPNEGEDDTPGWAGSRKIHDSEDFLAALEESPDYRLDEREFLRARLLDFVVGDPDRGTDQWRWARFGPDGDYVYRPIPRDRDWTFVQADGLLLLLSRSFYPKTARFRDGYPSIETLTFSSHILDRRLLTSLTRADFVAAAETVRTRLTDDVIAEAVHALPPEYETQIGRVLRARLVRRRDELPAVAQRFYEWLATDVDVHGTDEPDRADVERRADGSVVVRLYRLDAALAERNGDGGGNAYFERTFVSGETDEVRVYLHDSSDVARITGVGHGPIGVRVIAGGGEDRLEDASGSAHFYDEPGETAVGTSSVDTTAWFPPDAPQGFRVGSDWAPDWAVDHSFFSAYADYGEGAGIIIGGGPRLTWYGFRRLPYRWDVQAHALYATRDGSFGASAEADYRFENSARALTLTARAVQFDAFRFYGHGNDTPELDEDVTLIMQERVLMHAALAWHLGPRPGRTEEAEAEEDAPAEAEADEGNDRPAARLSAMTGIVSVGPVLQWTRSTVPAGNPLLATSPEARFKSGQVGARAAIEVERTDGAAAPRRGYRLQAQVTGFPATWDAGGAFGTADAQVTGYLPLIGETHVAARLGAAGAFGDYPAFESALVGGRHSLRGFRSDRFAGDAAVYGGAELRVPLGTLPLLVNGEIGIFGLADAARVWYDGETSGGWHTGVGGGLWYGAFGRAVSAAYAHGERGRFYLWAGLPF